MAEDTSAHHRDSIRPHPVLPAYYQEAEQRPAFVRDLFNRTAPEYDRINRLFSFNSGAWYRGRVLRKAGMRVGMRVLDVAISTGLVARHIRLADYEARFSSPAFGAQIAQTEFFQDPVLAQNKKVVATVTFTHPVDPETLDEVGHYLPAMHFAVNLGGDTVSTDFAKLK